MKLTPSKTITLECKRCGGVKAVNCISEICKLKDLTLSHLKRIKAHCLECVETIREVRACTGKLPFEDRLCYLYPYRLGHNPRQKGIGNPRFSKKPQRNDRVLASRNDSDFLERGYTR